MNRWLSGEWAVQRTSAKTRRTLHYWATVLWLTAGTVMWIILRDVLWFVGFMSLYAIWITHLAGWAAETPVEEEAPDEEAEATTNEAPEPAATSQGSRRVARVKVWTPSRPTGGAESDRVCDADHMSLVLRRWRHKYSPAARRGREAARKLTAHLEYTAWVAEQRALTRRADGTASEKR